MSKKGKNQFVTEAAREAGRALSAFAAVEVAARKIVDAQRSEELAAPFVGVHIVNGRITDVVARNGTVRIEEIAGA